MALSELVVTGIAGTELALDHPDGDVGRALSPRLIAADLLEPAEGFEPPTV
jgi:hypothetical protein